TTGSAIAYAIARGRTRPEKRRYPCTSIGVSARGFAGGVTDTSTCCASTTNGRAPGTRTSTWSTSNVDPETTHAACACANAGTIAPRTKLAAEILTHALNRADDADWLRGLRARFFDLTPRCVEREIGAEDEIPERRRDAVAMIGRIEVM